MFGHDDNDQYQQHDENHLPDASIDQAMAASDDHGTADAPAASTDHPAGDTVSPEPINLPSFAAPHATELPGDMSSGLTDATSAPAVADTNGLLDIKTQALQQLTPLVGHLEQSPEEKFRTTMMLIQASDDQSLVKTAYEAAKDIPDEKAKAQALLDIVNEINYFTHQGSGDS